MFLLNINVNKIAVAVIWMIGTGFLVQQGKGLADQNLQLSHASGHKVLHQL